MGHRRGDGGSQAGWSLEHRGPNKWSRERKQGTFPIQSCLEQMCGTMEVLGRGWEWTWKEAKISAGLSLKPGACLSLSFPFCTGLGESPEALGILAD